MSAPASSSKKTATGKVRSTKKSAVKPLTYTVFKVDGTIDSNLSLPDGRTHFELKEMQSIVGGYIEVTYLPNNMLAIYDEEGKMQHKNYAFNENASKVVGRSLFGTVIVCPVKMLD